jgi:hypothetical protein
MLAEWLVAATDWLVWKPHRAGFPTLTSAAVRRRLLLLGSDSAVLEVLPIKCIGALVMEATSVPLAVDPSTLSAGTDGDGRYTLRAVRLSPWRLVFVVSYRSVLDAGTSIPVARA